MTSYLSADVETETHPESIDEWIVEALNRRGPLTLDYLNSLFPECEATLLFAVDRLSRAGKIVISPPQGGDYLLSALPTGQVPVVQGANGLVVESPELVGSPVE